MVSWDGSILGNGFVDREVVSCKGFLYGCRAGVLPGESFTDRNYSSTTSLWPSKDLEFSWRTDIYFLPSPLRTGW